MFHTWRNGAPQVLRSRLLGVFADSRFSWWGSKHRLQRTIPRHISTTEEVVEPTRLELLRARLADETPADILAALQSAPQSGVNVDSDPNIVMSRKKWTKEDYDLLVQQARALNAKEKEARGIMTDLHGRTHDYLRISLTEKCNFRCLYCMPEEGVDLTDNEELINHDEIKQFMTMFVNNGVSKVRFTGGEPLLIEKNKMADLLSHAKHTLKVPEVCMTTNGLTLHRRLPLLMESGLTALNISLDTLKADKFEHISRRNGLPNVMKGIHKAFEYTEGSDPQLKLKINAVVMADFNKDEIVDFVNLTRDHNVQVRFIEYMPFDGNRWTTEKFYSYQDMVSQIQAVYPDFSQTAEDLAEMKSGGVAKTWRIPGFKGSVGFISSMSDHFCATCTRLRITADGNLKTCLFGHEEVSLRDALRLGLSDAEMHEVIGAAVQKKSPKLGGSNNMHELFENMATNRPMTTIGG